MNDPTWELLPQQGIENGAIKISFGMDRQDLRNIMSKQFLPPAKSSYPDEDDFLTVNESTFIRVRYEGTLVRDIEFLEGSLKYHDIDLHSDTTFTKIQKEFRGLGLTFRPTEWLGDGQDCPELGINIATHEDIGRDGDGVEWVILSRKFE